MAKAKKAKTTKKAVAKKPAKKAPAKKARTSAPTKLTFTRNEKNWLDDVIAFLNGAADGMGAHPTVEKNLRNDAAKYQDLIS
jgi:hypothetical protein